MLYLLIGSACFAFEADSIVYYHYAYVEPVPQPAEDEIIVLRYHQKERDSSKRFERKPLGEIMKLKRVLKDY